MRDPNSSELERSRSGGTWLTRVGKVCRLVTARAARGVGIPWEVPTAACRLRSKACPTWSCCATVSPPGTPSTCSRDGPTSTCRPRAKPRPARPVRCSPPSSAEALDLPGGAHLGADPGGAHGQHRPRRDGPQLAPGAAPLAPERTALRGAAGPQQEGDRRQVRRRPGEAVAAQLRHPAPAPVTRRREPPVHDDRYRDLPRRSSPTASAWPTWWCAWCPIGRTTSPPTCAPSPGCSWSPTATPSGPW